MENRKYDMNNEFERQAFYNDLKRVKLWNKFCKIFNVLNIVAHILLIPFILFISLIIGFTNAGVEEIKRTGNKF